MKKKLNLLLIVVAILAASFVTLAPGEPPPDPPSYDCSPGYWKNHPEAWGDTFDDWEYEGLDLMDALTQKGWGNKDAKWAAWEFLNENASGDVNCDD